MNMEQFLSDTDIKNMVPDIKIYVYSKLKKIKHMEEILPNDTSKICILYETEPAYQGVSIGHWVCLFNTYDKGKPYIEFFDSYGTYPDDELIKTIYKGPGILDRLILDFRDRGGLVQYNDYKLQSAAANVNTCGKHCVMRLRNNDIDIDSYKKYLDMIPININSSNITKKYDLIVNAYYNY